MVTTENFSTDLGDQPPAGPGYKNGGVVWTLRIAVALEFVGHGILAVRVKPEWVGFFAPFGIATETARTIMQGVGCIDIALACLLIVKPIRAAILWMAIWAMWTALLRPMSGLSVLEFVERGANWGAPLALLLLLGWPKNFRQWFCST